MRQSDAEVTHRSGYNASLLVVVAQLEHDVPRAPVHETSGRLPHLSI